MSESINQPLSHRLKPKEELILSQIINSFRAIERRMFLYGNSTTYSAMHPNKRGFLETSLSLGTWSMANIAFLLRNIELTSIFTPSSQNGSEVMDVCLLQISRVPIFRGPRFFPIPLIVSASSFIIPCDVTRNDGLEQKANFRGLVYDEIRLLLETTRQSLL